MPITELGQLQRQVRFLTRYAGVLTVIVLTGLGAVGYRVYWAPSFPELTAQRLNIVEPGGQLRLVLSNKERSPRRALPRPPVRAPLPGHDRPGLIFYNDEGTENGGLVFMGHRDRTGRYAATGHLSFDQYDQNQTLYLQYADENGRRTTGLHVDDWHLAPAFAAFRATYKAAEALPDGPAKEATLRRLLAPAPGQRAFAQRVFVGRDAAQSAVVTLADRAGQARLQLVVDSTGTPRLNFLDAVGKVLSSLPAPPSPPKEGKPAGNRSRK